MIGTFLLLLNGYAYCTALKFDLVVLAQWLAYHTVCRGLPARSGHTRDHHINGRDCLPEWHATR